MATERIWRAIQSLSCPEKPVTPKVPASVRARAADVAPAAATATNQASPEAGSARAPENGKVRDGSKTAKVLALVPQIMTM